MITIPGRIPISIHPLFWLLAALIGWLSSYSLSGTFIAMVVILFSVLFHEFGHALTACLFKQKARIELAAFGGFTYRQGAKLKLWEEFFVVANGPLAGFFLFVVAWLVLNNATLTNPSLAFLVKFTAMVNLFWTVVNLVPVLPLDGGHLLSIVLEGIFGFKGIKMAIYIGLAIAIAVSILFFVLGAFLVGALFLILAFEGMRSLRYYKMLTEKDRDEELQTLMKEGEKQFKEGNEEEALAKFEQVREKTKEGILYTLATEQMAQILKHLGRYDGAYKLLLGIEKSLSKELLPLFQFLAYHTGHIEKATCLAKESYQVRPDFETAFLSARSFAAKGDVEPAVGWLECSVREGLPSPVAHMQKKDFDLIRTQPAFQEFLKTLSKV